MADEDDGHLERIFKRFDANGDGKISSTELGDALKTLGSVSPEEVQRMMAEIDTDGDGFISYQEYLEFCNANRGLMKDVAKITGKKQKSKRRNIKRDVNQVSICEQFIYICTWLSNILTIVLVNKQKEHCYKDATIWASDQLCIYSNHMWVFHTRLALQSKAKVKFSHHRHAALHITSCRHKV
ncbi:hypothetical protein L1987_36804 [Smallanthus sonchifolius]|uniref:Uncharacterized protein n=1 Tax=Smallanthus sonchifolius TaxID=185202 RepID=A0ACB9HEL4_9ASTR|nr:hypothetical protein L1987_36804 [Smallanthus sonchifolius]